jgi:hypothetical protein
MLGAVQSHRADHKDQRDEESERADDQGLDFKIAKHFVLL